MAKPSRSATPATKSSASAAKAKTPTAAKAPAAKAAAPVKAKAAAPAPAKAKAAAPAPAKAKVAAPAPAKAKAAAPVKGKAPAPAAKTKAPSAPARPPGKVISKGELLETVAANTQISKKEVTAVLDELTAVAYCETKKNGAFLLPGFGKFLKQKRAARTGRNPKTGAKMKIAAKTVVKFRLAKAAKNAVL